jgi:hypothetical protein
MGSLGAGIISQGSPCEIRRKQWEALARGIISQGEAHEALARTEIRFEPAHFGLKFFEQPRNQATKPEKLCSFVALLFNHSDPHSPFRT